MAAERRREEFMVKLDLGGETYLGWKAFGKLNSLINNLFAICRDTFVKMGIGLEILEWIVQDKDGSEVFVEDFLKPLGDKYLLTKKWVTVGKNAIKVNLNHSPDDVKYLESTVVENPNNKGWVRLERKGNNLYLDGRKLKFYTSDRQQNTSQEFLGFEFREEMREKDVPNANILEALLHHRHLIPWNWQDTLKRVGTEKLPGLLFWGTVLGYNDGTPYILSLLFDVEQGIWRKGYESLKYNFNRYPEKQSRYSAILE
jgi:hypothetical protein